ncbi:MAG: 2-C-methyl-D-erythritol 4-phosphate cytidylyltransferase [Bacillota bacterium]
MNPGGHAFAVVVAAGQGSRMGAAVNKVYLPLGGRPLLAWTLDVFQHCQAVDQVCLVVAEADRSRCQDEVLDTGAFTKVTQLVTGGKTRQESVYNGVTALNGILRASDDVVAIHDGARPLLSASLLRKAIDAARQYGAAVPVVPAKDTVKWVGSDGFLKGTPDRSRLGLVQTPQVFRAGPLVDVLEWARRQGPVASDEAALFEQRLIEVRAIPGDEANLKVTTPHDLFLAETFLAGRGGAEAVVGVGKAGSGMRVGIGYDIHRLEAGRHLVLGGVELRHPDGLGLAGHSDADVALHAVMDALLGAAGLGDIGTLFAPSDPRFAGADSLKLLETVVGVLAEGGLTPANIDLTVVAEAPRISPHVGLMKQRIAVACGLKEEAVGVKATTNEGLGPIGEGRGIAAYAVATVTGGRRSRPRGPRVK